MDKRKVSFDEIQKPSIFRDRIIIPTPKKPSNLVKPDFSPIFEKQNQFGYKKFGSYKKQIYKEPESPIKSPNFKTSVKMKGRNLFGAKPENGKEFNFFKKLNFDDCADDKNNFLGRKNGGIGPFPEEKNSNNKFNMFLEKCEEEDEDNFDLGNHNINSSTQNTGLELEEDEEKKYTNSLSNNYNRNYYWQHKKKGGIRKCSINIENNMEILKTGKFEEEFNLLKTIKADKFSSIYKVQKIDSKKIYCIKKIVKTSPKSNIDNLKKITQDFRYNFNNILSQFCVQNIEYWIEKEEFKQLSELNFCNKNLYLLSNFYENGDIFDYLEKLEENKFIFTEDFYWDLVFEMIMGLLFVHECGYIHTDIQPGNYLVDSNGYLKLNLLELIAKIELPYNGELWHKLRDENFRISENFFEKCNIKNHQEFMILISQMILPLEKRPNLKEIINNFPKLKNRYEKVFYGKYNKSCEIPKFSEDVNMKILNLRSAPSSDIL